MSRVAASGQLQLAMWKRQLEALRDGDRFFLANDPVLKDIERRYGITGNSVETVDGGR